MNNFNALCGLVLEDETDIAPELEAEEAVLTDRDQLWEYIQRRRNCTPGDLPLEVLFQLLEDFCNERNDYLRNGKHYLRAGQSAGVEVVTR